MPELPSNLVKPPPFDNPLRRTASPTAEAESLASTNTTSDQDESEQPSSLVTKGQAAPSPTASKPSSNSRSAKSGRANSPRLVVEKVSRAEASNVIPLVPEGTVGDESTGLPHRITVRIDEVTRLALEAESHRLRIGGKKTNVAEIARSLLAEWATRRA